jgi:hypothetical protein
MSDRPDIVVRLRNIAMPLLADEAGDIAEAAATIEELREQLRQAAEAYAELQLAGRQIIARKVGDIIARQSLGNHAKEGD